MQVLEGVYKLQVVDDVLEVVVWNRQSCYQAGEVVADGALVEVVVKM